MRKIVNTSRWGLRRWPRPRNGNSREWLRPWPTGSTGPERVRREDFSNPKTMAIALLARLLDAKTDVYIVIPTTIIQAVPGIARALIGALVRAIRDSTPASTPRDELPHRLFIIDEARAMRRMDYLASVRDEGRAHGIHLMQIFQSYQQLLECYGRDGAGAWENSVDAVITGPVVRCRSGAVAQPHDRAEDGDDLDLGAAAEQSAVHAVFGEDRIGGDDPACGRQSSSGRRNCAKCLPRRRSSLHRGRLPFSHRRPSGSPDLKCRPWFGTPVLARLRTGMKWLRPARMIPFRRLGMVVRRVSAMLRFRREDPGCHAPVAAFGSPEGPPGLRTRSTETVEEGRFQDSADSGVDNAVAWKIGPRRRLPLSRRTRCIPQTPMRFQSPAPGFRMTTLRLVSRRSEDKAASQPSIAPNATGRDPEAWALAQGWIDGQDEAEESSVSADNSDQEPTSSDEEVMASAHGRIWCVRGNSTAGSDREFRWRRTPRLIPAHLPITGFRLFRRFPRNKDSVPDRGIIPRQRLTLSRRARRILQANTLRKGLTPGSRTNLLLLMSLRPGTRRPRRHRLLPFRQARIQRCHHYRRAGLLGPVDAVDASVPDGDSDRGVISSDEEARAPADDESGAFHRFGRRSGSKGRDRQPRGL